MNSYEIAKSAAEIALSKKASDVVLMDLRKVSSMADYFIVCTGDVDLHVKAIVDEIKSQLRDHKVRPWHVEGYQHLSWVLMDYVDVVVHVFRPEVREFYNLEKLWGDAPAESFADSEAQTAVSS